MKLRKLFAWLMTLVMLLGMIPVGHAEAIDCDHNWVWRWPNGQPANCQDWKWSEKYCTKCGVGDGGFEQCGPCVPGNKTWVVPQASNCQEHGVWEITCKYCGEWLDGMEEPGPHKWVTQTVEQPSCDSSGRKETVCSVCGDEKGDPEEIPALGHNWGSWHWAHGEPPCNSNGAWQVRDCQRCGRQEDRWVEGGQHNYGPWKTTQEPTCITPGRKEHTCTRCGHFEWAAIPQLDHVFGEWHVVQAAQIGVPGLEQRDCTYGCGTNEQREIPPLDPNGTATGSSSGLNVYKKLIDRPADETVGFVAGEQISYMITVENKTGVDLFNLEISDPLRNGNPVIATYPKMPADEGVTVHFYYIITDADVANGSIVNTAYASAKTAGGLPVNGTSNTVTTPVGTKAGDDGSNNNFVNGTVIPGGTVDLAGLSVTKSAPDGSHAGYYYPGEVVPFTITVTNNTGVALIDVEITDPIKGGNEDATVDRILSMQPGESVTVTFPYTTTEADAAFGTECFWNTAYATGYTADGTQVSGTSNTVKVHCVIPHEISISKTVSGTPANGEFYVPGETICFIISMSNDTTYPLYCVTLTDPLCEDQYFHDEVNGMSYLYMDNLYISEDNPLGFSQSARVAPTYVVTEADAEAGFVTNTAIVHYQTWYGENKTASASVTVKCGKPTEANTGLTVDMTYTNTPANGSFFTPGEVINYLITVTNTGDVPLTNLQVGNSSSEAVVPAPSEIAPGQTIQVPYYKLVYEGDAKAGGINSYGHANAFNGDPALPESLVSGRSADVFVPCGMGDGTPSVYYLKIVANAPANGLYFTEGETIKYRLSFGNNTKKDIYNITLNDPMANTRSVAFARRLKAGEFLMGEFEHVVTAADVAAGQIVNTATSTWATKAEGALNTTSSNTVVTPTGDENALMPGDPVANGVSFIKQIVNAPANGLYFVPGEEIQFSVTVQNNMDKTLDIVVLTDPLSADFFHELLDIPGGAMDSRTLSYTVTEFDAELGSVINYAYAVVYVDDQPTSLTSNTVSAPCGFPEGEDPFGVLTGLDITKAVESLPLNGSYYTEGETVAYKITYTNSGELPLTDVMIYDAMGGMSEIATAETLTPGESRVCWFNHTVTADDVARGYISNTAIGQFELNGYFNSVSSNTVTVDTNGKQDIGIVYPFWPGDEYDPGTGWLPGEDPSTEGGMPPFGTIDTDTLRNGDAYCVRTITGRDNVSVGYETSFCTEHADTQASILAMNQVGKTPEMQMQAATYAVALWRSEVEKLYQDIFTAADPMAKATVMTEYIRFLTEVANYEALLKNLHPDQPALAAKKIAAMWEDKCVTLCYEMHATAAQRKDSLLSVTPATGAAASECACATTDEVNGKKTYTQSYCPVHGFPFGMIDMLLQSQDTAEAWTMIRQIWSVELSNAYNKAAAKLGVNSALAMVEYNALTQWMMAREASLIALYPENPEVVVQTMVKLIMDRVNDLCQVTK